MREAEHAALLAAVNEGLAQAETIQTIRRQLREAIPLLHAAARMAGKNPGAILFDPDAFHLIYLLINKSANRIH